MVRIGRGRVGVGVVVAAVVGVGCGGGSKGHGSRSSTAASVTSGATAGAGSGATAAATTSGAVAAGSTSTAAAAATPPAAATGLTARRANVLAIELAWTDAATNETSYVVERRAPPAAFAPVATLPANSVRHRDAAPDFDRAYEYRVVAVNAAGSSPSNPATATTGLGLLVTRPTVPTSIPARRLAVADFDKDGDLDVATAYEDPSTPDQVFWNDGQGNLTDSGHQLVNPYSSCVLAADLDGIGVHETR